MQPEDEFPDTFLPRVARAADRALAEVLEQDRLLAKLLGEAEPKPPRRRSR